MKQAFSVNRILNMKKEILPWTDHWFEAFANPERIGVWFIWGNSGNGKSSFVMQLCKELTKYGSVLYDSLEEGVGLTMQETLRRFNMQEVSNKFQLLNCEPVSELSKRLKKRKSADFIVIDSFQYAQLSYKEYLRFKKEHENKLLIFVSHADGRKPSSRSAVSVMFDATLKIWVEGYRAFSKGRFIGPSGRFDIWDKGVDNYWGLKNKEK